MKTKIILLIILIVWLIIIFMFSNTPSKKSNNDSKKTISNVVQTTVNFTNKIKLTHIDLTKEKLEKITNKLNYPLRKVMHATVYFVLALLSIIVLSAFNITGYKAYIGTFVFCLIYALTDEFHQLYIDERTGQLLDVFIDSIGAILAIITYRIFNGS